MWCSSGFYAEPLLFSLYTHQCTSSSLTPLYIVQMRSFYCSTVAELQRTHTAKNLCQHSRSGKKAQTQTPLLRERRSCWWPLTAAIKSILTYCITARCAFCLQADKDFSAEGDKNLLKHHKLTLSLSGKHRRCAMSQESRENNCWPHTPWTAPV